ncbi:hypothetical protein [Fontivita pretiosa]|uniref:hypothetical protein n=1 Tax=Fontivita pretiosa TaxID=2989684 RepID=UPI003D16493E
MDGRESATPRCIAGVLSLVLLHQSLTAGSARATTTLHVPVYGASPVDVFARNASVIGITEDATVAGNIWRNAGFGIGTTPFRFRVGDPEPQALEGLGAGGDGTNFAGALAINASGTIVGQAQHATIATYLPVRWDAAETAPTPLGHLGTDANGQTTAPPLAINARGTAVGYATAWSADGTTNLGSRAVRWDAGGTAATPLGQLGYAADGSSGASAWLINDTGIIAGVADKYDASGRRVGQTAVRWDVGANGPTELGLPGAWVTGRLVSNVEAIDAAGTIVGSAVKIDDQGRDLGTRAVFWPATTTTPIELGLLNAGSNEISSAAAYGINANGTIIGTAQKDWIAGVGARGVAVRWDPVSLQPTELPSLDQTLLIGEINRASDINDSGLIVGYSYVRVPGSLHLPFQPRAVCWLADGTLVNLNDLIDPDSGWLLMTADAINNNGWIAGTAYYDPRLPGGFVPPGYANRLYVLQIPEPATTGTTFGAIALLIRLPLFTGVRQRRRG